MEVSCPLSSCSYTSDSKSSLLHHLAARRGVAHETYLDDLELSGLAAQDDVDVATTTGVDTVDEEPEEEEELTWGGVPVDEQPVEEEEFTWGGVPIE
ncbi:MAG: hypothetical protein MAG715_00851 [Methanonatronarchaeales archaeon]|nr:hypothetical protein [Methanonatronarchaeales archaeon]